MNYKKLLFLSKNKTKINSLINYEYHSFNLVICYL